MHQRKVVSNKLFPKIYRLSYELLELHTNENLMRKILKVNREWGTGRLEERNWKSPYFIQTFKHLLIPTFLVPISLMAIRAAISHEKSNLNHCEISSRQSPTAMQTASFQRLTIRMTQQVGAPQSRARAKRSAIFQAQQILTATTLAMKLFQLVVPIMVK